MYPWVGGWGSVASVEDSYVTPACGPAAASSATNSLVERADGQLGECEDNQECGEKDEAG